jgi:copper(I)-binding protein
LIALTSLGVLGCRPARGGSAASATISIGHAVVPAPPSPTEASAFMTIDNRGTAPDSLTGVSSPEAEMVMLHEVVAHRMAVVDGLALPPGGRVMLALGGYHLMLHGLTRPLATGDTVTLEVRFAHAGHLTVRAPVLRYSDAVEELP